MTCSACTLAERDPLTGRYDDCPECRARALAHSPQFAERNTDASAYIAALGVAKIAPSAKAADAMVKAWANRIQAARGAQ